MAQGLAVAGIGGGGLLASYGSHQQGQSASRAATMNAAQLDYAARQTDIAANQQEAAGQMRATETKRQARLLQSRAIAVAAAGGASTGEKNINDIVTNIAGEGEYRALIDLYNGNSAGYELRSKAQGLRAQAIVTRYEGKQARRAGNMAAFGGLLSAGGAAATTFGSKYDKPDLKQSSNINQYPTSNYYDYKPTTLT